MITILLYMNNLSLHTFTKLLQNYYTTPISKNVPVEQEVNRINTVIKPKKDEVQSSSTNHIYQKIKKGTTKRKNWDNSNSLRKSKK